MGGGKSAPLIWVILEVAPPAQNPTANTGPDPLPRDEKDMVGGTCTCKLTLTGLTGLTKGT